MTCVIGFTDREKGISWIGADSLGSNGYTKETQMPSKVFRNETFHNVLLGGTTTFRHLDLLKYATNLFDEIDLYKKTNIDHKFMVTKFIPYDEDSKKAAETLDKYDFTPILKRCYGVDIYDIEDWIKDYGDDVAEAVENLADYELADYLHQKYGMGIQEVSRYCAWWNDRKQGGIM